MVVELSPSVLMTLCGLVSDALQEDSDAASLLHRAARELAQSVTCVPGELAAQPERLEALRRAGFVGTN